MRDEHGAYEDGALVSKKQKMGAMNIKTSLAKGGGSTGDALTGKPKGEIVGWRGCVEGETRARTMRGTGKARRSESQPQREEEQLAL